MAKKTPHDFVGKKRCLTYRAHDLGLVTKAGAAAETSAFMRRLICEKVHEPPLDEAAVKKDIDAFFAETGMPSEGTRKARAEEAKKAALRYLRSEKRTPFSTGARTVSLFGKEEAAVCPDAVFKGMREEKKTVVIKGKKEARTEKEPYVEAVVYRYKKPDVSLRGRNPDTGVMTSIELYLCLLYVKELVHGMLEEGTTVKVGASFYFLKKSNDGPEHFNPLFFEAEKGERPNTVTLWDTVTAGDRTMTDVDLKYSSVYAKYRAGEDLSGSSACTYCELAPMCGYSGPGDTMSGPAGPAKNAGIPTLTPAQADAAAFREGVARINAGAGSGKTLVVAMRTARLIAEGVPPEKIMIITFTDAGAGEFRERTAFYCEALGLAGGSAGIRATTFNSFGNDIVRERYKELGFAGPPRLIDEIERMAAIAGILEGTDITGLDYRDFDMDLPSNRGALPVAAKAFDAFKRGRVTKLDAETMKDIRERLGRDAAYVEDDAALRELFGLYTGRYVPLLKEKCLIEYDDQILLVEDLLKSDPDALAGMGFAHITVDEFQDTDAAQFELLKELMRSPDFKSLMVVGDDSQSIYGFRGSAPEFMIDFAKKLGRSVDDFYLVDNHRSTPEIIRFANGVNALNENRIKKDLKPVRPSGTEVKVFSIDKQGEITPTVVELAKRKHAEGVPYEDIAYIAYSRSELARAKKALDEAGIKSTIMCPEPCLDNPRIKGALALAGFISDPGTSALAFEFLSASLGGTLGEMEDGEILKELASIKSDAERIAQEEPRTGSAEFMKMLSDVRDAGNDEMYSAFLKSLADRPGLEAKLRYCGDYARYGSREAFKKGGRYDGVSLVTAHSSKGREYPVVINDVTKYDAEGLTPEEVEEKRRLMFVSVTRARDDLTVMGRTLVSGTLKSDDAVYNRFLEEAADIAI